MPTLLQRSEAEAFVINSISRNASSVPALGKAVLTIAGVLLAAAGSLWVIWTALGFVLG